MELTEQDITKIAVEKSPRGNQLRKLIKTAAQSLGIDLGKREANAIAKERSANEMLERARQQRIMDDDENESGAWTSVR